MKNITRINELNIPELSLYKETSEVQLLRLYEPNPGVFIAESSLVIERALNAGFVPISALIEEINSTSQTISNAILPSDIEVILDRPEFSDIPVYAAPLNLLQSITGYNLTRGILSVMQRKPLEPLDAFLNNPNMKRLAVLESVVNPTNVGAIFRNAAALGIDGVILTGNSSDPLYRRAIRVSMGNVFQIPWTISHGTIVEQLKNQGYKTVALALNDNSISISDPSLKISDKIALFLGSEGYGLSNPTIEQCDYVAKIPMTDGVDSLNVAAASALAFWEISPKL